MRRSEMSTPIYVKLNEALGIDGIIDDWDDTIPEDASQDGWGSEGIPRTNTWNKGTNLSGMKDKKHSEETKRKMSEAKKGKPNTWTTSISEEQKEKISNSLKGRKRPDMDKSKLSAKGKERTPAQIEAAKKHSERMKGRTPWNKGNKTK